MRILTASAIGALLLSYPAFADEVCRSDGAQYAMAGGASVRAALGRRVGASNASSDLFLTVSAEGGKAYWFGMDRGAGIGDTSLNSSQRRLDQQSTRADDGYIFASQTIVFFDDKMAAINQIVRSGDAAPRYFLLIGNNDQGSPGQRPPFEKFPDKFQQGLFVRTSCGAQ